MNRRFTWALSLTIPLLVAGRVLAADTDARADRKETSFIKEAAQGGQAEVQMGSLAAQKGQSEEVKQLGQHLVQDHSKANDELKQIAQRLGVTIPSEPPRSEERTAERLQNKTGADFDKAFVEHAIKDHIKDIEKFQKALQNTKDTELSAFIEKSIPVLRQHLSMARNAGNAAGVDEKVLSAADKLLSQHGSDVGQTHGRPITPRPSDSTGTAPGSQSGQGANQGSQDTKPNDK